MQPRPQGFFSLSSTDIEMVLLKRQESLGTRLTFIYNLDVKLVTNASSFSTIEKVRNEVGGRDFRAISSWVLGLNLWFRIPGHAFPICLSAARKSVLHHNVWLF